MGLPALYSIECQKKGTIRSIDGGLACLNYSSARKRNGNSNPIRWISNTYFQLKKIEDRRNREIITLSDCNDIKNFLHYPKDRLTDAGLDLYEENKNMHEYVKGYFGLKKNKYEE